MECLLKNFHLPAQCRAQRFVFMGSLLAGLMAGPCAAQASPQHEQPGKAAAPTFSVTTRLVVLDVVVTDKAGNLVSGLSAKDFSIYEDKQEQTIRSFEAPGEHRIPEELRVGSTADLARAPEAPVTILVLDELNTRFEDMSYARQSLEKYLRTQPAVLAEPMTLLAAGNTKFQVLMDYTRDRQALLTALDAHFPEYPWRLMQSGKTGPGAAERLAMSLGTLQQIAQATAGHPGRKNLIWVGRGFPSVNTNQSTDQEAAVLQNAVAEAIDSLRDARVTLYTVDPTINSTDMVDIETPDDLDLAEDEDGGDPFAGDVNFQLLAPATGGRVYFSRNDVGAKIGESIDAGENYYTISYSPTNGSDAAQAYRRIGVKIDRPELTATTRNGYYVRKPEAPTSTSRDEAVRALRARLAFDLGMAANSNIAYTGLSCSVTRITARSTAFHVSVDPRTLSWRDLAEGNRQAEVTLLVASFDVRRKMIGHSIQEMRAQGPFPAGSAQPAPADFAVTAAIPAGAVRLRFVLRDAMTGKIGTVDFNLHGGQ